MSRKTHGRNLEEEVLAILAENPKMYYSARELAERLNIPVRRLHHVLRKLAGYSRIWLIKVRGRIYVSLYLHRELAEKTIIISGPSLKPYGWALDSRGDSM